MDPGQGRRAPRHTPPGRDPAGAIWALTTTTGQRLAMTVLGVSMRLLESLLMGGTDLLTVGLAKLGRPGRWAAGGIGNASAQLVVAAGRLLDSARRTLGPWVAVSRLPIRVVNGIAGLVFLQQLSGLLAPAGAGELLAEVARATTLAAGVLAGDQPLRVDVQPSESTSRIRVEGPHPDGADTAEEPMDGGPAAAVGGVTGSRQQGATGDKRTADKRPGPAGRRR